MAKENVGSVLDAARSVVQTHASKRCILGLEEISRPVTKRRKSIEFNENLRRLWSPAANKRLFFSGVVGHLLMEGYEQQFWSQEGEKECGGYMFVSFFLRRHKKMEYNILWLIYNRTCKSAAPKKSA